MKKLLAYIFFVVLIGIFVYWAKPKIQYKGIKKIENLEFTAPVELKLEKIYSIDSTNVSLPVQSCMNSNNELYVLEYFSQNINIFDENGKFIHKYNSICDSSSISSFALFKDTLFVSCIEDKSYRKINKDGKILNKIMLEDELPIDISFIDNDNIIGLFRTNLVERKQLYVNLDLKLVDKHFNQKKLISSFFNSMYQLSFDPEITMFPHAVNKSDKLIYLGVTSPDKYMIFVYDFDMKLQFVVENKPDTIKVTKEELKLKLKRAKKFKLPLSKMLEFKENIENILCDPEGNIWVRRGVDYNKYSFDTAILDVFRSNGKYLRSFFFKNTSRLGDIKIFKDKMVVLNPELSKVDVYKFNLPEILK